MIHTYSLFPVSKQTPLHIIHVDVFISESLPSGNHYFGVMGTKICLLGRENTTEKFTYVTVQANVWRGGRGGMGEGGG